MMAMTMMLTKMEMRQTFKEQISMPYLSIDKLLAYHVLFEAHLIVSSFTIALVLSIMTD